MPPARTHATLARRGDRLKREFPACFAGWHRRRSRGPSAGCSRGWDTLIHLIQEGLRYVPGVARRYLGNGPDLDELIAAGHLGVVQAAIRFEPQRKMKFITYADWWIRKAILEAIETLSGPLRMPRYRYDRLRRLRQARAKWTARHGETPTTEQLASVSGMPIRQVVEILATVPRGVSLDHPTHREEQRTLGESLQDPRSTCPQASLIRNDLVHRLRNELAALTSRERAVVRLRFGFGGRSPMTLRETGRMVDLSRERVRQIERRALRKIRREI